MRVVQLIVDNRQEARDYRNPGPWFGTAPAALLEGFAFHPREVEVHVVSCTQQPMAASPPKLAGNIWFHSLVVPKIGWLRTGYSGCIRAVRQAVEAIGPDLVHAQGTERDCAISGAFLPCPKVLTIHGNLRLIAKAMKLPPWNPLRLAAFLEGWTVPRYDGIVCITDYTRRFVAPTAQKTWLVNNATDTRFFNLTLERPTLPTILFVAAIDERKNQVAFLDAIAPLAGQAPFRIRFLGQMNRDSSYGQAFLERLGRYRWASFDGFLKREETRDVFRRSSALVLPSLEDNCPMTVLEAASAGLPVMASAVGGIPELIEDGITGLLCDPKDPVSMREKFAALLEKIDDGTMARTAKEAARRRFHPAVVAAGHLEIYRQVLGRKPAAGSPYPTEVT